jgi:hypothetical protein
MLWWWSWLWYADDCIIYKTIRNREDTKLTRGPYISNTTGKGLPHVAPSWQVFSPSDNTKQKPNKTWLHPSQTCHAERDIHKISPSDNTNMSIRLQYQPHKRHPQNISEWQYKHVNKLTVSATQKTSTVSIYIRIFGGLYESVRVTVCIMSCSQVGWSKHICWVYWYKVECDSAEVDGVLIRLFANVDQHWVFITFQ